MTKPLKNTSANERIAKNSIFMTVRMLVVLLISLYTTRVVLSALGVADYGLYNVVCGFVSMFAFLNNSMTGATQRYYNYEIGSNGDEGVRKVYCAAIIIHASIAVLVVVVAEFVGLWYIKNKLVVEPDRVNAAIWIFHFSLCSLFLNILNAPYTAAIMAYEKMNYYAIIGVVDAVLKLLIAFVLFASHSDRLILYGFLFFLITVVNFNAYRIYAKLKFKALKLGCRPTKSYFQEMLSFAGWNLFGSFAYMMREQGINILLNSFFGPVVNAAKGVANQVNGALQGFAGNLLTPARPQIIQSYAKGDQLRSFRLMNSISKLTCLAFLLMSLPVCVEIKPILKVWLGENIPDHASSFVRILLITNTWGTLVAPISAVVHATGKMKFYQIISSASNLMSVPLAFIFLLIDKVPEYVFYALLLTMFTNHLAGLVSLKRLTSFSIKSYFKRVVRPLATVLVLSTVTVLIPYILIHHPLVNFITVVIVSLISVIAYSYFLCLDSSEKQMISVFVNRLLRRV